MAVTHKIIWWDQCVCHCTDVPIWTYLYCYICLTPWPYVSLLEPWAICWCVVFSFWLSGHRKVHKKFDNNEKNVLVFIFFHLKKKKLLCVFRSLCVYIISFYVSWCEWLSIMYLFVLLNFKKHLSIYLSDLRLE